MTLFELFILAVGLSMDAFAVSICKGLAMGKFRLKNIVVPGLWFGGFQAGMPLIGYFLGSHFASYITPFDHWIAFVLLGGIGVNMIREAVSDEGDSCAAASLDFKTMFVMSVATSIDALAVGVTFAFLNVRIVPAVSFIGVTTFILSCAGVMIGSVFGAKFKKKAELMGGVILVLLGTKILLEHLGVLPF